MNNSLFYKGLLAELNKTADVSLQQPQKKKSFIRNPVLWGSLGLGLAGLGAYKKFSAPSNPSAPVVPQAASQIAPAALGSEVAPTTSFLDNAVNINLIYYS